MNKKGFTLMELLLVVAVLAIVAAAAAPTFFGGAQEAMEEAKKASMYSAYQNCISGANMLIAIAASKGVVPTADGVLQWSDPTLTKTDKNDEPESKIKTLNYYSPVAGRVFTDKNGINSYIFSARYNATARNVDIYCGKGTADANAIAGGKINVATDTKAALEDYWKNTINK